MNDIQVGGILISGSHITGVQRSIDTTNVLSITLYFSIKPPNGMLRSLCSLGFNCANHQEITTSDPTLVKRVLDQVPVMGAINVY